MTLPELYPVGAPKAGTTSVADWRSTRTSSGRFRRSRSIGRPTILACAPTAASTAGPHTNACSPLQGRLAPRSVPRGRLSTCTHRRAVPAILAAVPIAKFIVCPRDPVDPLLSYHRTQLVALNEDEVDFGAAWRRSVAGRAPSSDPLDEKLVDYPMVGSARLWHGYSRWSRRTACTSSCSMIWCGHPRPPGICWHASSLSTRDANLPLRSGIAAGACTDPPPCDGGPIDLMPFSNGRCAR